MLHGGVANVGAVVRVGDHVLRPSNPHTADIHRFLTDLRDAGFDGVPRPVGVDPDGRERLEYVEGDVALPPFPGWFQEPEALASVARLLARFHAASADLDVSGLAWSSEMGGFDSNLGRDPANFMSRTMTLPGLKEYAMVSQDECRVELHRRRGDIGWDIITFEPGDTVELASVELALPIADVYFESGVACSA